MPAPVFTHRPNACIQLPDGRELWHSRSVAVVATVLVRVGGVRHVALMERGPALPDEVGKLALPGGYLDWDETSFDAARREVFEEVGLDVAGWTHARTPWRVHDEPIRRQNVTLHYYFLRDADALPPLTAEHSDPNEVTATLWKPLDEAEQMVLAFGHHDVLRAFRQKLAEIGERG